MDEELVLTDRSATSFANSGWLLPVSNLIELVAMIGIENVIFKRSLPLLLLLLLLP